MEIPEVPVRAITEAVVNSLCHRDYESPEANEIAVYKDRIEIYNPGLFPENMKPEDYLKGNEPSRPRNMVMAGILYYSKDIEKWGSGLKRISEDCEENGVKVDFSFSKTGYRVVFYRNNVGGEKFGEKNQRLLRLIENNKYISIPMMAKSVGLTTRAIEKNLAKLKVKGLVKRIGGAKGGHWKVIKK
ncbi:MAG: hypothetical protein LLG37_02960 [Spirochaetia bacterium]|nr:hypothetical protein [Spirochaetia bacterium]